MADAEPQVDVDQARAWLVETEEKLRGARRQLAALERRASRLTGRNRTRLAPEIALKRQVVEGTADTLRLARHDLGIGPLPTRCGRTLDGRLRCELAFGHGGLHRATPAGGVRRRWE